MTVEHTTPDSLDRYIDQTSRDSTSNDPQPGIDPDVRETIHALRRLAATPPMRPGFADELETRLAREAQPLTEPTPGRRPRRPWRDRLFTPWTATPSDAPPMRPQGWSLVFTLATTMAVVAALFFVMRPLTTTQPDTVAAPTAGLPAGVSPATVRALASPGLALPIQTTPTLVPTPLSLATNLTPGSVAVGTPTLQLGPATPRPVGTPFAVRGRLGAPVYAPPGGLSPYPLYLCDGSALPVYEGAAGLLSALIGREVSGMAQGVEYPGSDPRFIDGPFILSLVENPDLCAPATPIPPGRPTPAPTGTPFVYAGRLGQRTETPELGPVYPLIACNGSQLQLVETATGQLLLWIGRDVRVIASTQWVQRPGMERPVPAQVVQYIQLGSDSCPTPISGGVGGPTRTPVVLPGQPSPTPLSTLPPSLTPPLPPATPTAPPQVFIGRLRAETKDSNGVAYYPFETCQGLVIPLFSQAPGSLEPYIDQEVRVMADQRVIASQPQLRQQFVVLQITTAPGVCSASGFPTLTPMPVGTRPPTSTTPPGEFTPTPVPLVMAGRLRPAVQPPSGRAYYPFERCDGTIYRAIPYTDGFLEPYVEQEVRIIAEPQGIPMDRSEEPAMLVFQVEAAPGVCASGSK